MNPQGHRACQNPLIPVPMPGRVRLHTMTSDLTPESLRCHRADAREPEGYRAALGDTRATLLLTDPPYCLLTRRRKGGDQRDPRAHKKIDRNPIVRFETVRDYRVFTEAWLTRAVAQLTPEAPLIIWTNLLGKEPIPRWRAALGYTHLRGEYVWGKRTTDKNANEQLLRVYEVALVFARTPAPVPGPGDAPTVWAVVGGYDDDAEAARGAATPTTSPSRCWSRWCGPTAGRGTPSSIRSRAAAPCPPRPCAWAAGPRAWRSNPSGPSASPTACATPPVRTWRQRPVVSASRPRGHVRGAVAPPVHHQRAALARRPRQLARRGSGCPRPAPRGSASRRTPTSGWAAAPPASGRPAGPARATGCPRDGSSRVTASAPPRTRLRNSTDERTRVHQLPRASASRSSRSWWKSTRTSVARMRDSHHSTPAMRRASSPAAAARG